MSEPSSSTESGTHPTDQTQTIQPNPDSTSSTSSEASPPEKPSLLTEPEPKAEAPAGAPEKYTDFTLPDGVKLADESLTKAQELFKGLNLPQAGAQSLVDFYVSEMQRVAEAPGKAFEELTNTWITNAKADPEIGNKLPVVKANIGKAYDVLINAVPEKAAETRTLINDFKSAMDITGVGNHPAFIKVLNRLAERIIEPGHVSGAGPSAHGQSPGGSAPRPSVAQSMYPNNPA